MIELRISNHVFDRMNIRLDAEEQRQVINAIVGIVRNGELLTVMLRRFNQPMTKDALRVDSVKWAIKPPPAAQAMGRRAKRWRKGQGHNA